VYRHLPSFILGFHGCDKAIGEKILSGNATMRGSENSYDWLGNGRYFWEQNPYRAWDYAKQLMQHPERSKSRVDVPFVIGAIIDPGLCLNLLESQSIELLSQAFSLLEASCAATNIPLPSNEDVDRSGDFLLRKLDCAVVELLHTARDKGGEEAFQTVRGVFQEGPVAYPGAGFKKGSHIQICVRDAECIKGFFRPRVSFDCT
jgi:hypothetical protein